MLYYCYNANKVKGDLLLWSNVIGFEPVGLKTKKGSLRRFECGECKDNADWVE